MKKLVLLLFVLISIGQLAGELLSIQSLASVGKFLLMPTLGVVYWTFLDPATPATFNRRIMFALLFSYFGDIFLLFAQRTEILFILGLVAFLIAHLAYLSAFTFVYRFNKDSFRSNIPAWSAVLLFYTVLMWNLMPYLESSMIIAVPLYGLVICSMLLSVVNTRSILSAKAFRWLLLGGVMFILSDTTLALIKFHPYFLPHPFHDFLIMFTYILGQFGLIWGSILIPHKN
jgi:uncharacterized membrane protein YhhN